MSLKKKLVVNDFSSVKNILEDLIQRVEKLEKSNKIIHYRQGTINRSLGASLTDLSNNNTNGSQKN